MRWGIGNNPFGWDTYNSSIGGIGFDLLELWILRNDNSNWNDLKQGLQFINPILQVLVEDGDRLFSLLDCLCHLVKSTSQLTEFSQFVGKFSTCAQIAIAKLLRSLY